MDMFWEAAMSKDTVVECAIVGAGMSGLYSAWRLASALPGGGQGVHVFEMSDRVGGRLEAIRMAGMPHVPAELGEMRILKTQPIVRRLVDMLALPTVDGPAGGQDDHVYLRGRHFEARDYADPSLVPYDLRDDEEGLSPSQLVVRAIEAVVPGASVLTPQALRAACEAATLNGYPLRQHGIWQVLGSALSIEAFNLVLAGGGFDALSANWNAAEAVCRFMAERSRTPGAASASHLRDGCDAIPLALWDCLVEKGGRVHLKQELTAFRRGPDGCHTLTFRNVDTGQDREVTARNLILAMPKRSLQRLAERAPAGQGTASFLSGAGVGELIDSVEGHAVHRLALAYPEPWWNRFGPTSGDLVTDLPLRRMRYLATEGDQPGADPRNRNALLVATYADGPSARYWDGVRASGPRFLGLPNDFAPHHRAPHAEAHAVSTLMVDDVHRQVAAAHGLDDLPRAYDAAFRDWGDDPFGGGWHSWKIGVNAGDVMRRIIRPVDGEAVFICGEAYSTHQGWVEGALQTAETMLTQHFGLAPLLQPMAWAS